MAGELKIALIVAGVVAAFVIADKLGAFDSLAKLKPAQTVLSTTPGGT